MRIRVAVVFVVGLALAARARAGNDDGLLIGNEAMLTGGAVTAVVSDGAAGWYNPAGLGLVRRSTFNINASTYGVSRTTSPSLFTLSDGTRSGASVIDWQLVPSALSYARELSRRVVGAFGIFVPTTADQDLRASVAQRDGTRFTLGLDEMRNEYAYVFSVGVRQSEALRWGVSLHGVYISDETVVQIGLGVPGSSSASFLSSSSHRTTGDYGIRLGVGVQWDASPRLTFGASLMTPTLTGFRLVASDDVSGTFSAATPAESEFAVAHESGLRSVWELSTPLSLRIGAGLSVGRVRYLLDASLSSPLNSQEDAFDRKLSGNARAGVTFALSDTLTLGGGLFTDLDGYRGPGVDFVGAATGLRFAKDLTLASGHPLTFVTSLGLRYAFGWGRTVAFDLMLDDAGELQAATAKLRVNELAINLGGGVSY